MASERPASLIEVELIVISVGVLLVDAVLTVDIVLKPMSPEPTVVFSASTAVLT